MDAMGLTPHVKIPTHRAGHTLDQIYTILDSQVTISECHEGHMLSDHTAIKCKALVQKTIPQARK